ncbi:MAG: lyase family protein [Patescibacteria group bacterium]
MENLSLPGNPRYQPKQLVSIFGYDNLYSTYVEVEMAALKTLYEFGIMPKEDFEKINSAAQNALDEILTSEVDEVERKVTKHDIRALVQIIQKIVGPEVGRWVHVPLTSYDVIDTGRSLQFVRAFKAMEPSIRKVIFDFNTKIFDFADTVQIGRTHGQHALPITVGFWLATINQRIFFNYSEMRRYAAGLVGKISGAVGAYNAQRGLGIFGPEGKSFEGEVLKKLGLRPAPISTQILPPEPLGYFLFSCVAMSASLGQFGRDCRQLMRSEIGEVAEAFSADQVGSSTMAHKRNPINFENLEGTWLKNKNEFGKVLDTLISEHQRDLVGSCISRDFPTILINLQQQLNTLLRPNKSGGTFLSNITIDVENCRKNLEKSQNFILAEPLYIALQMAGYPGDAHKLVNHCLMPIAKSQDINLFEALLVAAKVEPGVAETIEKIPEEVKVLLQNPDKYTGFATDMALDIIQTIEEQSQQWYMEDKE